MKITLKLSESLLSIYRTAGKPLDENITLELEGPITIRQILIQLGVTPLLTPMISLDGKICGPEQLVEHDAVITLIGPLAGG